MASARVALGWVAEARAAVVTAAAVTEAEVKEEQGWAVKAKEEQGWAVKARAAADPAAPGWAVVRDRGSSGCTARSGSWSPHPALAPGWLH